MTKLLLLIVAVCSVLVISSSTTQAQGGINFNPQSVPVNNVGGCDGSNYNSPVCQDLRSTGNPLFGPSGILTRVARVFALITGIISIFIIIISGLRYVNSGGDPQKTASARNGIIYAAIGVTVAVVAGSIVEFVLSKL